MHNVSTAAAQRVITVHHERIAKRNVPIVRRREPSVVPSNPRGATPTIVIVTPETRTVEWKTYGIVLKLQPKMDAGNKIRTQITAEISTVDHGSGSSQVPGFLTRRVTTHFSSPSGCRFSW